jgi:S-adenosylmethionine:tRNA ribosyltransferase-isomerase
MEDRSDLHYDLKDYDYDLPDSLIAQEALEQRESCRLLVMSRKQEMLEHRCFSEIGSFLHSGDVLVLNDTRVVPARLLGTKQTGGKIELLVLEPFRAFEPDAAEDDKVYSCLVRCAKPPKPQSEITLKNGSRAEILTRPEEGKARVRFLSAAPLPKLLEQAGEVPLPPYIHRAGTRHEFDDATYYQTVYAWAPGSVAAPTAGLHFTTGLLHELERRGVEIVMVTLHVGYGTFAPMRATDIRQHCMHPEYAEISIDSAQRIALAKTQGRRIVAVGTTSVRILEWVVFKQGTITGFSGYCDLYIYPGFRFRVVDAVITNFHLPKTTLLLLVSAFAGREAMLHAYHEAIREKYRFFSYGDAMLIL